MAPTSRIISLICTHALSQSLETVVAQQDPTLAGRSSARDPDAMKHTNIDDSEPEVYDNSPGQPAENEIDLEQNNTPTTAKMMTHSAASWNPFRYIADFVHLAGIFALIHWLYTRRSLGGLSQKTQILYLTMYVCRYLDLLTYRQATYLIFFKVTYIGSSCFILYLFRFLKSTATYEQDKDTVSMPAIIVPCCITAIILTAKSRKGLDPVDTLWAFSEYLEGFAMVPQYVFCYRENAKTQSRGVILFIMALGVYRVFYAFNWIYKLMNLSNYYDIQSWLAGFIEIAFFFDFLSFQYRQKSLLRSLVLVVDDKITETVEKMELVILPGRREAMEQHHSAMQEMRQRRVLGNEYDKVTMEEQL